MERVSEYRENAAACRELADKMPAAQRDQLMEMARQWDRIAEEREAALSSGAPVPDLRREDLSESASPALNVVSPPPGAASRIG